MSLFHKLIAVLCLGVVVSTHAWAQDAPRSVDNVPAVDPRAELYGLLVLMGAVAVDALRTFALSNCDGELSDADIAAVQAWLTRMGVDCNGPQ